MADLPDELASKRDRLLELLRGFGSCLVAFSGGVDSVVLAYAAHAALGDRAAAATGRSVSLPAGELDEARRTARQIGIHHEVVDTDELALPAYRANLADRCYHCKNELYARLEKLARRLDLTVVADGNNLDDQGEHRPGLEAARRRMVRSPLAECRLTKPEIRRLAEFWGLAAAAKPATPCLSSRIAYGEQVTPERLAMIDRAERFLRERGVSPPLRVRYHKGDAARIEASVEQLAKLVEPGFRRETVEFFRSLGFKFVSLDLEGFRSGSLNAGLLEGDLGI